MKPAMPAEFSRWPRLVLTEPSTSGARLFALTENLAQGVEFDRVAQRGAGAVRLDVVDLRRLQPRRRQRRPQHRLLGRTAGHRLPAARTVLVDGRTANQGQHRIPVAHRITEPLEYHHAAALAAHVAVGGGVEGLALAVRRQHPPPRAGDAVFRSQDQVGPGGQRLIRFPPAQALVGQVDGDQRRRARGVEHHGRAVHAKEIRQPSRGEVRRIAERQVRVEVLWAYPAVSRSASSSRWWSDRRRSRSGCCESPWV